MSCIVRGISYIEASTASIIATIESISALIFASIILNEKYSQTQLLGVIIIISIAVITVLKK